MPLIDCPDKRAADPTACDSDPGLRNPAWQDESDDEMETTFTTCKPCDAMATGSPLNESAGRPKGVGASASFANPLYETAGNVTGKLAVVIEIKKENRQWLS